MQTLLVFPHQLFESILTDYSATDTQVIMHEHPLYFTQYRFHTTKLFYHRATMQLFADRLRAAGFVVQYESYTRSLSDICAQLVESHVIVYDTADYWLDKNIGESSKAHNLTIEYKQSPQFLLSRIECINYAADKKSLRMQSFYEMMRKKFTILVDSESNPAGGKWSFDSENRKKYDGKRPLPPRYNFEYSDTESAIIESAHSSIVREFPNNPGVLAIDGFPLTHDAARAQLRDFLVHRLEFFGIYEDAMVNGESELFHSKLSAAMNNGLLEPLSVVRQIIAYADTHPEIGINSLEGCIRQIIGWREYMRLVYITRQGEIYRALSQSRASYRTLSNSWYDGTTGIAPVDDVIMRMLATAYSHHIERLMVIGNMFQLLAIDPREVYEWFMMYYIDAYDWVMLGNVYAMSQYVTQTTTTKPYISGSRYILSMSNYSKGDWTAGWDGLYWNYIADHYDEILRNPRMAMMARMYDKLGEAKQNEHKKNAKEMIERLTRDEKFVAKNYIAAIQN